MKLTASIRYEMNDLVGCKQLIDQCPQDDPDTLFNQACLIFKVCHDIHFQNLKILIRMENMMKLLQVMQMCIKYWDIVLNWHIIWHCVII